MPTVLVVESDNAVAVDIQARLQRLGYDVPATAATAAEALARTRELRPDVVLVNIGLRADTDASGAAGTLQQESGIPVLFLTARSDDAAPARVRATGPHGYVLLPCEDRELYAAIEVALSQHEGERQHQRTVEERSRREEQLRHTDKMEALARLASVVAHDVNNIVAIIKGYCELAMARVPEEDSLHADLRTIQEAAERATRLTGQLLAFGRRRPSTQTVDLSAHLPRALSMLRPLVGEDIALVTRLHEGPLLVGADPGQLDQVLANLALNAREAMPQGGQLHIETSAVELGAEYPRCRVDVEPGSYVRIRVRDTGCGMSADILSRAFEPFFTTKGDGKTAGLGLAVAYGIVRQSRGHIDVDSHVGAGTTFDVFLPLASAAVGQT